jgi:hypothetical protein
MNFLHYLVAKKPLSLVLLILSLGGFLWIVFGSGAEDTDCVKCNQTIEMQRLVK